MKYFYNQNSRFLSYFVKKKTKKKQGRQISVAGSGGFSATLDCCCSRQRHDTLSALCPRQHRYQKVLVEPNRGTERQKQSRRAKI